MEIVEVTVNPGVCRFKTYIKSKPEDRRHAALEFKTECPNLKPLESELVSADAYKECFAKVGKSGIYESASKYCKHAACPVPMAIIKGIEASCGLAVARDVKVEIKKLNQDHSADPHSPAQTVANT